MIELLWADLANLTPTAWLVLMGCVGVFGVYVGLCIGGDDERD